jgi:hypothetical protein
MMTVTYFVTCSSDMKITVGLYISNSNDLL